MTQISDVQLGKLLRANGFSAAEARNIVDGRPSKASATVKPASAKAPKAKTPVKPANTFFEDVIVAGAKRRERNRALAAQLRKAGKNPGDPKVWAAAQKAAGIR